MKDIPSIYGYHSSCYNIFTHKGQILRAEKRRHKSLSVVDDVGVREGQSDLSLKPDISPPKKKTRSSLGLVRASTS